MNPTIEQVSWHGQTAWQFANDTIRTLVVPEIGAKLASLFDKRSGREWLVGPGERPLRHMPYGASFVEQDMSGWDEMFPTIVACEYPAPGPKMGTPLPDHGEVWPLPWTVEAGPADALRLSVRGVALRYELRRELRFAAADTLQMHYELLNMEAERMAYLWAAHPQFACGDAARIVLPQGITAVHNALPPEWGWGDPETPLAWPVAGQPAGPQVQLDAVGPPSKQAARKFFVPPVTAVNWAGLVRQPTGDWLRLEWDAGKLPYLGIWIDEGRISPESVVALEPMTGYYDSLATAWTKERVALIEPGETQTWDLFVRLGTSARPLPLDNDSAR